MTYVLSDIHGNLQRFESIMTQINLQTNDTLYVLGDVIDRYAGGIKILRQIMRMPNAEMLIGNHEYMMLNAIGHCKDAAEEKENTNRREKRLWYRNGGMITHEQLKHYRKDIRAEIFDFIRQLPTNLEVEVNQPDAEHATVNARGLEAPKPPANLSYTAPSETGAMQTSGQVPKRQAAPANAPQTASQRGAFGQAVDGPVPSNRAERRQQNKKKR